MNTPKNCTLLASQKFNRRARLRAPLPFLASALSAFLACAAQAIPAFPGAYGFGGEATGGRGGAVYHVTNLNDSGPGSFRDAVSVSSRTVVFDVGGYVNLSSAVSVKSNLTIAGQTAPGDGIGFMGREVSFSNSSNVIVRYVRFRQGTLDPESSKSGINLLNASNEIFDHVSIEFAQWNNVDAVGASNITFQSCIIADPIGQQFCAHTEGGPFTWYGNLFANGHNRCPLAKADTQYVNNVIYNYQAGYTAGNTGGLFSHDLINNYFITGPRTTSAGNAFYQMTNQLVYSQGNYLDSSRDGLLNGSALGYPGSTTHLSAPWSASTAALPTTSAADAYTAAIANAGCSLHRDDVDALVISDVTSLGTQGNLWGSQSATGLENNGYGTLSGGTAPVDTDGDGIPDSWETSHGLDPKNAADANGDRDGDGYTNLEEYLNSLVNPVQGTVLEAESLSIAGTSGASVSNFAAPTLSNGQGASINSNGHGAFAVFLTPSVTKGSYLVFLGVQAGPKNGQLQLAVKSVAGSVYTNLGQVEDTFSSAPVRRELSLGLYTPTTTGQKDFRLTVVGKNAASSSYEVQIDYIKLVPQ